MFSRAIGRFLSFEAISVRMVVLTALASYFLQIASVILGDPLYIIAFFTLLPWIPIVAFEGIWKVENYGWVAVFGIIVVLQIGHFAEHLIQVVQIDFFNGTTACPPPVDNADNALNAVRSGLRGEEIAPTFYSSQNIIKPGADGLPLFGPDGQQIVGPAACGVFGQLDIELVHLLWELIGWFGTLLLLTRFPRNVWLWIAAAVLSWHALEHLSISYFFYFDTVGAFDGLRQIYATTVDGNIVAAVPIGLSAGKLTFYEAAGKFGILAKNGLFDTLFGIGAVLPDRPHLHMIYNLLITVPTLIGFWVQASRLYNRYLATALPTLTEAELVELTPALEERQFESGEVIIREGDIADRFYIIASGAAEVVRESKSGRVIVGELSKGQYFGEIGLLESGRRTATVRALGKVRVLAMPAQAFAKMVDRSSQTKDAILATIKSRSPKKSKR
jgi:hypothetical protein